MLLAVALIQPGTAARANDRADAIRPLAEAYLARTKTPGVVVGVLSEGKPRVFGFGAVEKGSDRIPDGDTLYEIGSITKVFTGIALADLVARGRVGLDEPVAKLLPAGFTVPERGGKAIRVIDLATHTSGLPRIPALVVVRAALTKDPYANFGHDEMRQCLEGLAISRDPGETFDYSNLGFGLLGFALARRAGLGYEELIVSRICRPLGMDSTRATLRDDDRPRLARPHGPSREPAEPWTFDAMAGAGALKSSANDLLRFVAANLDPPPSLGTLATALADAREPRRPTGREGERIGLGWIVRRAPGSGRVLVWHNGGTGGSRSFLGFLPERKLGVVVLANSDAEVDSLAAQILRAIAPEPEPETPAAPTPPANPEPTKDRR